MFRIFLFSVIILINVGVNFSLNGSPCESVNVKTVIWKRTDLCRKCWLEQDILKAYARRVVQDLLPRRVPRKIPLLVQYFKTCWQKIPTEDESVTRYALTLALADAIGGYLQAVALPIANEAYYAGNVDYTSVAQLYRLFEELKMVLGTDGGGWSKPCDMKKIPTKVSALDLDFLTDEENPDACRDLHIPLKSLHKISSSREKNKGHSSRSSADKEIKGYDNGTKIPLPFLDDDAHPNAIAVPLRDQLLYSLHQFNSAHILVRFYVTALKCIGKKDKETLIKFNQDFYRWIIVNVVPHLHEKNKLYVGFGSVMRIIETMHQQGWTPDIALSRDGRGKSVGTNGGVVEWRMNGNEDRLSDGKCDGGGRGLRTTTLGVETTGGGFITGGSTEGTVETGATGGGEKTLLPPVQPITSTEKTDELKDSACRLKYGLLIFVIIVLTTLLFCVCLCCICIIRRIVCESDAKYVPLLSLYYKIMKGDSGPNKGEEAEAGGVPPEGKVSDYDSNATGATVNTDRGGSSGGSTVPKQYPPSESDETTTATTTASENEGRAMKKRK